MDKKRFSLIATFVIFAGFGSIHGQVKIPSVSNRSICNLLATYLPEPVSFGTKKENNGTLVAIDVLIGEEGNFLSSTFAFGLEQYRLASETAASKAKFHITTYGGKPVQVQCRILYSFNRSGEGSIRVIDCLKCNEKVVSIPRPKYPANAVPAAGKFEGIVSIEAWVGEDGTVKSARGVSGHSFFRTYLEQEVKKAKFKPILVNGKPIGSSVVVKYQVIPPNVLPQK